MKQCVICKEKVGMLSHKTYDGRICKKCSTYIPMSVQLKSADTDYLLSLYVRNKEKSRMFDSTASYGTLYIDSSHGLLCVSRGSKGGEPTDFGDIYSVIELQEISVYCTDIRNIGKNCNKIICNVKLRIRTADVATEYLVCQNEPCNFTYAKGNSLNVREPEKLTMFRNMIYQMIDDVYYGAAKRLEEIRAVKKKISDADCEKEWARGILFLDNEECSIEEIKKHQRLLIRTFHPDLNPEFGNEFAQKINKAYKILIK